MTDKFIAVANKQEADRAAKYLESLGYRLTRYKPSSHFCIYTTCVSTCNGIYYYSDNDLPTHSKHYEEEQLFVPDDFEEPMQEPEEEYVLSGGLAIL